MSGRTLFLVPARGGSRRVPGKNLALVGGIPLVGWAVRTSRAASLLLDGPSAGNLVVCSTDDDAIAAAAAAWGGSVLRRPAELATDDASSAGVALHALQALRDGDPFDTLVLVQPTSPLLEPSDLAAAVRRHREHGRGVTSVVDSHPAGWHQVPDADGGLSPARETPGGELLLAGACYIVAVEVLRRTGRLVNPGDTVGMPIPAERAIDIDEPWQLAVAEALLAARPVRPLPLGGRLVGTGPVFVIAEAGVNHDGDVTIAHRLVDAAADAGADAVKFQTFDPGALAAAGAPTAAYQQAAGVAADDQLEMLRALTLPADAWAALQRHALERGIAFLSTPFDDGSAELLDRLDVPAFKVGSGELTNTPFIARLARRGRPLLLSTGMADMVEVAAAVDAVRANGDVPLALFHCVSSYPAAPADANLRAIETMRRAFGVPVGWSDHTQGTTMPIAAVAAGATLVEKHLTLDRTRRGPDHAASLEPDEMAAMVRAIREVEAALGTGEKVPVDAERDVAAVARRSLHWASDLDRGAEVRDADLAVLRPGTGMRPSLLASTVGRRTARAVRAGMAVAPDDLEPPG